MLENSAKTCFSMNYASILEIDISNRTFARDHKMLNVCGANDQTDKTLNAISCLGPPKGLSTSCFNHIVLRPNSVLRNNELTSVKC